MKLRSALDSGPLAPGEVRRDFIGWPVGYGGQPPIAYVVRRGEEIIGRVLDWTDYPETEIVERDPVLGYVMSGSTKRPPPSIYGFDREASGDPKDDGEVFLRQEDAIIALAGEDIDVSMEQAGAKHEHGNKGNGTHSVRPKGKSGRRKR